PEHERTSILILESDPALAALLTRIFAAEHYEVMVAFDAPRALAMAASRPPALVLLDLTLPGMPIRELSARLRAQGLNVPTLVISAAREGSDVARDIDADAFIAKAFGVDEVLERVHELLRTDTRSGTSTNGD